MNPPSPRSLLFLLQSAPYDGQRAQEGLEALFAARIFDIPCTVVFIHDGVWQFQVNQHSTGKKSIEKMLGSLPMYDIDTVYLHAPSLRSRDLQATSHAVATVEIDDGQLAELMAQHHHCLTF